VVDKILEGKLNAKIKKSNVNFLDKNVSITCISVIGIKYQAGGIKRALK